MKRKLRHIYKRHERTLIIVLGAGVVFCIAVFMCIHAFMIEPVGVKRLVTVYDRGKQRVVLTRAQTVQDALNAADVKLNPNDEVEPKRESKLSSSHVDVIIYRSRMVSVIDGNVRQTVVTVAQSPNAIIEAARLKPIGPDDKASFSKGDLTSDGAAAVLAVERAKEEAVVLESPRPIAFAPLPNALTASKGAQIFVDSLGVAHRETYYDLPMNVVIRACGDGNTYTIRSDGAKVDQDGYVLVAANLRSYPRCTVVETSLGPGKVYDTGGFAVRHPYGFDLATDWTNYNGL